MGGIRLRAVSRGPAPDAEGFEVVVGIDGALTVPADELARRGVRPGAHLRVVPESAPLVRRSVHGVLAGVIDGGSLDALETALDHGKADRIAATERRWG